MNISIVLIICVVVAIIACITTILSSESAHELFSSISSKIVIFAVIVGLALLILRDTIIPRYYETKTVQGISTEPLEEIKWSKLSYRKTSSGYDIYYLRDGKASRYWKMIHPKIIPAV